jgi:predicted glycoside hydrolase/deacetylase ChbG (UPF0249 family)
MMNSDGILLVTTADDFGLDAAVNEAVERAFLAGTLTSASMMAGMPGTEEAARISRRHRGLSVGLHLNLTVGNAISGAAPRTLTDQEGRFRQRRGIERSSLVRRFDAEEVERELLAQLDALRELDVEVDHIDGHQHVHILPGIFPVVERVARARRLAVRIPHHRFLRSGRLPGCDLKKTMRRSLLTAAMQLSGALRPPADLLVNDHFRCFFDLQPRPRRFLLRHAEVVLRSLRPGITEWMLHPSTQPVAGEEDTPLGRLRTDELELLTSWDLGEQLVLSTEITLVSYGELRQRAVAISDGTDPGGAMHIDAAAGAEYQQPPAASPVEGRDGDEPDARAA